MNIKSAIQSIVFICTFLILSSFACEDNEITEASEAFRNCAASSEDTIYRRVREEKEEDRPARICSIIDSVYSGCKAQKLALEKCKGVQQVANIFEARFESMKYILGLTYPNVEVASCTIFKTPEEVSSEAPSTTSRPNLKINRNLNQNPDKIQHREELEANIAFTSVPNSFLLSVIMLLSLRAYH